MSSIIYFRAISNYLFKQDMQSMLLKIFSTLCGLLYFLFLVTTLAVKSWHHFLAPGLCSSFVIALHQPVNNSSLISRDLSSGTDFQPSSEPNHPRSSSSPTWRSSSSRRLWLRTTRTQGNSDVYAHGSLKSNIITFF